MTARVDIAEFDDTALGAEIRHLRAEGHESIVLVDSSQPDDRADVWVDGTRGLYKLECANGHVWLSVLVGEDWPRSPLQSECPTCRCEGEFVHA